MGVSRKASLRRCRSTIVSGFFKNESMKITITLTAAQVKGIKEYLKDTSGEINPKITSAEVATEIKNIVSTNLQSGAVYDYISKYEN